MPNGYRLSYLDQIRQSQGADRLKSSFAQWAAQNKGRVIDYIKDDQLSFPCLFILLPEIDNLNMWKDLPERHLAALHLCAKKWGNHSLESALFPLAPKDSQKKHDAYLWMFQTGSQWEGPKENYDPYDAAMDASAALLLKSYRDKTILPAVAELIFRRNRKDLYIHDLVWGFLSAFDPAAARLIARHLLSSNEKDVALACNLLHLPMPSEGNISPGAKQRLYRQYLSWLSENGPFLYPTGECFQLTSDPEPLGLNLDAKYIGKEAPARGNRAQTPLAAQEVFSLNQFHQVSPEEQALLSAYSRKLRSQNKKAWEEWMRKPTYQQLGIARAGLEVGR